MKLVIFYFFIYFFFIFMLEVIRIGLKIHYCPLALSVNAYDEERWIFVGLSTASFNTIQA